MNSMEKISIEIEDKDMLLILCGENDKLFNIIKKYFNNSLYITGNKIEGKDLKDSEKKLLKSLIYELCDYISRNNYLDKNIIKTLYVSLLDGNDGDIKSFKNVTINLPRNKTVLPKNMSQSNYLDNLNSSDVVFGIGPAGTGKTYLAIAYALRELLEGKVSRIVLTRPVVESGESLGFLPGDLTQKIGPYLIPLYDAMRSLLSPEALLKLEENDNVEVAPLAYMRGRSIDNSIIILDEAQNTTKGQMKMFLTRLGYGSKAIVVGDITQIDIPKAHDSGLIHAERMLQRVKGIGFTYFKNSDVVRNPLVKRIIKAYDKGHDEK